MTLRPFTSSLAFVLFLVVGWNTVVVRAVSVPRRSYVSVARPTPSRHDNPAWLVLPRGGGDEENFPDAVASTALGGPIVYNSLLSILFASLLVNGVAMGVVPQLGKDIYRADWDLTNGALKLFAEGNGLLQLAHAVAGGLLVWDKVPSPSVAIGYAWIILVYHAAKTAFGFYDTDRPLAVWVPGLLATSVCTYLALARESKMACQINATFFLVMGLWGSLEPVSYSACFSGKKYEKESETTTLARSAANNKVTFAVFALSLLNLDTSPLQSMGYGLLTQASLMMWRILVDPTKTEDTNIMIPYMVSNLVLGGYFGLLNKK